MPDGMPTPGPAPLPALDVAPPLLPPEEQPPEEPPAPLAPPPSPQEVLAGTLAAPMPAPDPLLRPVPWVTSLAARAAGTLGGAMEGLMGAGERLGPLARRGLKSLGVDPPPEVSPLFESGITDVWKMSEEDLQRRLEASAGQGALGLLADWRSDVADNLTGLMEMASFMLGDAGRSVESFEDLSRHFAENWQAGKEFGQVMLGGLVGGQANLLANLPDSLETRPLSVLLIFLPLLRAAKATGRLPSRLGRVLDKGLRIEEAIRRDVVSTAKLPAAVIKTVLRDKFARGAPLREAIKGGVQVGREAADALSAGEPVTVLTPAEWAGMHRWLRDSMVQENLAAQEIVDKTLRDPGKARAEIEARVEQAARAIERGDLVAAARGVAAPVRAGEYVPKSVLENISLLEALEGELVRIRKEHPDRGIEDQYFARGGDVDRGAARYLDKHMDDVRSRLTQEQDRALGLLSAVDAETGERLFADMELRGGHIAKLRSLRSDVEAGAFDAPAGERPPGFFLDLMDEMDALPPEAALERLTRTIREAVPGEDDALRQVASDLTARMSERMAALDDELRRLPDPTQDDARRIADGKTRADLVHRVAQNLAEGPLPPSLAGALRDYGDIGLVLEFDAHPGRALATPEDVAALLDDLGADAEAVARRAGIARLSEEAINDHVRSGTLSLTEASALRAAPMTQILSQEQAAHSPLGKADVVGRPSALRAEVRPFRLDAADPLVRDTLAAVAEAVQSDLRLESLFPDIVRPSLRGVQEQMRALGRLERPQQVRLAVERVFASVFDESMQHLLRVPEFRLKVAQRIHDTRPAVSVRGAAEHLKDLAESTLLVDAMDYVVRFPETGEAPVSFLGAARAVFGELPEPDRRQVKADAVRRIGHVLSMEVERRRMRRAMLDEVGRGSGFGKPGDEAEYTRGLVRMAVGRDEALPQFMVGFKPRDVAGHMEGSVAALAEILSAEFKMNPVAAERAVRDLAREVRFGYTSPSDALLNELLIAAEPRPFMSAKELRPAFQAVAKGYESSVGWYLKAAKAAADTDAWASRVSRAIRANLTVLNVAVHKNNLLANTGLQALIRGKTLHGVGADLAVTQRIWSAYKAGKLDDPMLAAELAAIERTGIVDTGLVEVELQMMAGQGAGLKVPILAEVRDKIAGPAYRFGDAAFKLDDAIRGMRVLGESLDLLGPGEWLRIVDRQGRPAWLMRRGDGAVVRAKMQPKRSAASNRVLSDRPGADAFFEPLTGEQALATLADAAVRPGEDKFFNYADVPNYLHFLRTNQALGVISPFLVWMWKALDIPGVKRGLVGHALLGDVGPEIASNNPVINANAIRSAAEVAMRRAVVFGAARATLLEKEDDPLIRASFLRLPKDARIVLINNLSDPRYIEGQRFSQAESFGPTNTLFRIGVTAFYRAAQLLDPDWSEDNLWPEGATHRDLLDPAGVREAADRAARRGEAQATLTDEEIERIIARRKIALRLPVEGADAADVIGLLGVAGAPLAETVASIEESAERGEPMTAGRIFREFGAYVIGGTPANAIAATAAAFRPDTDFASYRWALREDSKESEEFVRWAVRMITGMGWQQRHTESQRDDYLVKVEGTMRASLVDDLRRREEKVVQAKERGSMGRTVADAVLRGLRAKQATMERVIGEEIRQMRLDSRRLHRLASPRTGRGATIGTPEQESAP